MPNPSLRSYDASTTLRTTTLRRPWSRNGTRSLETDTSTLASLSCPLETLASHRQPPAWVPHSDKDHGRRLPQLQATRARLRRMVTRDPSPRSPPTTLIRPTPIHSRKLPKRTSTQHRHEPSLAPSRTLCVQSVLPRPPSPLPLPIPTCSTPNVLLCSRYRQLVTWLWLNDTSRHQDVYQTRPLLVPSGSRLGSLVSFSFLFWHRHLLALWSSDPTLDIHTPTPHSYLGIPDLGI